ncbi:uncharacterized protein LOC118412548 [Branchiostoma floridae]|uniref:Uncharacterized protein LOC118412548 n=1 Tax=Branchiostoma floridae TaxID=7739 RepID=A0A9J7KVS4_BRAFL|nr:uncharacterized protein LOC118412548 [Branchiostoma floridae]
MDGNPLVIVYCFSMGQLTISLLFFLFTAEPLVSGLCLEEGFGDSGCDSFRNLLSDCGHIQTAGFPLAPYKNDTVCEWHIHVRPRHRIVLVFDRFQLEESGETCEYDQLSIHDGVNEKAPKLGTFCGRYDSFKVLSSRNHLYLKFTSDASMAAAGFYASYVSEEAGHEAHQAIVDMGQKTFPCPGSLNITGDEMALIPLQLTLQSELRERMWITWDPWGVVDKSYLRIYEGNNINTTPVVDDNFRQKVTRSFSPKGHQFLLSLHLWNRDGGVFMQCFIEDVVDELPLCFPDPKNTNVGSVVFGKNMHPRQDDAHVHCKIAVKAPSDQQLLASMDLVNTSPTISTRQQINGNNARVDLYDGTMRLGSMWPAPYVTLPLPTLTSGNELLIILWKDSANLQSAQWTPKIQYSPTGCRDLSHHLTKNGTTTIQAPCGIFKHLPDHDFTNYDYRIRIEMKENMFIEILMPPLSRYEGIRFMCKGMKDGCDEDLQIYDLQGNSPVLIYSYCREAEEDWKTITSSSHAIEMVYRSFCTWSRSGFYFHFRTTECTQIPTTSCKQQQDLQAPCGFFQPPPRSDVDRQPLVCDWHISPPPGNKAVLTFQNLSLTADQKGEDFILIQELEDDGTFRTVLDIRQSYPLFSVELKSSQVMVKFVKDRIGTKKDPTFTAFYTTTKAVTPNTEPIEMEELCESGFQYYRSNCYRVVVNEETLSWETAQQRCTEAGSDLASISSPEEMEHVKELLERETGAVDRDSTISAFIGLMTTGHDAKYAWVDGSKVLFTYWRGTTPLPAGQNTESCALMLTGQTETKWFTVPCNYPEATRTYICKAKARGCNKDWTMVGFACLRPYELSSRPSNPSRQADRLCSEAGSSVATVNSSIDFLRVQGYLQNMWPVYPRPRVYMNIKYDGSDTCGVVERRYDTEGDSWIVPRTDCAFRRPNLVLCSMRVDASTCPSSCKCSDGVVSCINKGLAKIPAKIPRTTRELYLARNRLNLTKDSLRTWRLLTTLDVSENSLREIPVGTFSSMFRLKALNISGNLIHRLTAETFKGLASLHVLDLTGNNVNDVSMDAFQGLPDLYKLNTNQYKLCCMAPQTNVCSAQQDYVSSCEHLIGSNSLTVTTWFLGVVSIVGNPAILIYQVRSKTSGPSKHFLCNLAIADALTGLYMIIIASANTYYQDRYILNEQRWRSHAACAIATGLVTFSKMASLFLVVAIVVQIHLISRLPSTIRRFKNRYIAIMIATCWMSAFMCTVVTMNIPHLGLLDVQTTAACSPFIDIIQKQGRWKYWFVLFVTLPTIMTLASVACWSLSCYVEGLNSTNDGKNKVKHYEKQRTTKTIIVTDFICWIIVAVVGMFSTVQDDIFVTLTPWIALFVVPVTCGLNPMIQVAAATQRWPMKREVACKDDVEVETVEQLCRSLHEASNITAIEKDENSEGTLIQSYLQCLSGDIVPSHVVKVLLQFRKGYEIQQESAITNEMMILRRIGQAGGHQNVVRQCAIADKDAMKWALYTLHHHYKLREVLTDLTSEDLLTTNLDMTKALKFLHQNDIVLGKMSLDALLVEKEPHLKVLIADFSNAKVVGSNNNSNKDFDADFQEWKKLKGVIERKSSNFSLPINIVLRRF